MKHAAKLKLCMIPLSVLTQTLKHLNSLRTSGFGEVKEWIMKYAATCTYSNTQTLKESAHFWA